MTNADLLQVVEQTVQTGLLELMVRNIKKRNWKFPTEDVIAADRECFIGQPAFIV